MMQTNEEDAQEPVPETLWKNTKINGVTWLGGVGPKPADIMFISPVVSEEEAAEKKRVGYDTYIDRKPRFTDCGQWQIIKTLALEHGVDIDSCYVTSIVKYLPENKSHRSRPPKTMLQEGMTILENEIKRVKPKIIVCLGKVAFDQLHNEKLKESDIYGAWFDSRRYKCRIYPMMHISQALKPEKMERWHLDFATVNRELRAMSGDAPEEIPLNYLVIRNSSELKALVDMWELRGDKVFSIDGEWHGCQHIDGKLRTFQFCWAPGQAACVRFMDDQLNYAFDVSYKEAGKILGRWLNRPDVKYIGHHVSVDLTWMHYWLGLDWYHKAIFDSEFATQICDESLDLGLDAVALRYTPFGKYDLDLIRWKKANPHKADDGYGLIPDDILLPYANRDVDTAMRSWPHLTKWMEKQGLTKYYDEICNPFVTDVFTFWCLKGIPVDRVRLNEMRDLYNWAKGELEIDFRSAMVKDARKVFAERLEEYGVTEPADAVIDKFDELRREGGRAKSNAPTWESYAQQKGFTKKELKDYWWHTGMGEHGIPSSFTQERWDSLQKEYDVYYELYGQELYGPDKTHAYSYIKELVGVGNWADMKNVVEHYIQAPDFNIRSKPQMQRWLFDVKRYTPVKSTANKAEGMPSVDWNKILAYPPEKQKLYTPASDKGTLEILARRYDDKVIDQLLELNAVGNLCKAFLKPADVDEDGEVVRENGIAYWQASDDRIHLNHSTTPYRVLHRVTCAEKESEFRGRLNSSEHGNPEPSLYVTL